MLCQYRDIFGKSGQGAHSIRILNIAVIDTLATLLVGALIAYYTGMNVYATWLGLFILGIFVHRLFCVNTTVNKWVFGQI
jgi:hypothetical protein